MRLRRFCRRNDPFAAGFCRSRLRLPTQPPPSLAYRAAGVRNCRLNLILRYSGQDEADFGGRFGGPSGPLRPDHLSWYELGVVAGTALAERLAGKTDGARGGQRLHRRRDAARPAAKAEVEAEQTGEALPSGRTRPRPAWLRLVRSATSLWPGRRAARHNLAYWRGRAYLGLGPSAVRHSRRRALAQPARRSGVHGRNGWGAGRGGASVPCRCACRRVCAGRAARHAARAHAAPRAEHLDPATRARERLLLGGAYRRARAAGRTRIHILDLTALPALAASGYISLRGGTTAYHAKGEVRRHRGVRAPVSRYVFIGGRSWLSSPGRSKSCVPSSRST